ncbi:MAG: AsmA-like C-terminal region-containing protein [Bacteroidetes bacterium]|nr:AsmA-like C-terminal region-containing protein [Bacteroidota bacterium]
MRNIKSIFIGLILGVIILIGILSVVSYIYEDEVSQYLIEELNENILTEIEAEDVNFSLIKKFPKASVEFKNVLAHSKDGFYKDVKGYNTDTLFFAQSIFVKVDILDLIQDDISIHSIHFNKGNINLFTDHLGDPNYIFWKEHTNDSARKDFSIELSQVKITNADILYCNDATNIIYHSWAEKIDFEGNLSRKNYLLKIKANQLIYQLSVEDVNYVINKNTRTNLELDVIDDLIHLNNGNLNLQNLAFSVNGKIEKGDHKNIDLLISGNNLNLKSFLDNLPEKFRAEFPNIIGQKGEATLKLSISGDQINRKKPHIEALFLLSNTQLFDMERDFRLSNVNIEGQFTNGNLNSAKTSKLVFKTFNANIERNYFEGSFELSNFSDPKIALDLKSELYFDEIKNIFKLDTMEVLKGVATTKIKYQGLYQELKSFEFKDLFTKDYAVEVSITDGAIKIQENPVFLDNISGNISLMNTLYTDSLYFKINNNDFLIKGRISKLFEFFNKKEIFNINARVFSNRLNLNELAVLFQSDNAENKESFQFPEKLALQLRLNIDNFEAGKFNATDIHGNLNYKPKMFSLHELSFNSMNGHVKAGGVIIQKYDNNFTLRTQSRLDNININKLFYSFNNFGQTFISNQNLEGNLTGDVFFSSEWSNEIKVKKESVVADCDIKISNGELNNFEPMKGLSKFIDMDELEQIQFSTLENKITIKDEQISIPQMDINSSALNLTASGVHQFSSEYEYHVQVLLSDLLSSKMRNSKRRNQSEEYEEDLEGRIMLYLLLKGDKDKSKVKYDRKAAKSDRKENMQNEKRELKQILNEEFGWFKKDSTVNTQPTKESDQFEIEFEENRKKQEKEKHENNEQRFTIEWEEDTTVNHRQ